MPIKPDQRQYRMMASPLATWPQHPVPAELPDDDRPEPDDAEEHAGAQDHASSRRIDSECYVEGYATTFEDPYLLFEDCDGWKYYEIIERGALDGADVSDVILQYDHSGYVYARTSNGTLVIEPDEHGLLIAADMSRTTHAREMFEDIESGNVTRMSWAFIPVEQSYEEDRQNKVLTTRIKRVSKVYDVSAVSMPADPNTEISARRLLDGEIEARKLRESQLASATRMRMELTMRAKAMAIHR